MHTLARRVLLVLCMLASTAASVQAAQDANADLYDAAAPANSAFIRVLNLGTTVVEVTLSGKKTSQKIGPGQLGGYRFTPPGPTRIAVDGASIEPPLQANTASTLLYRDGQLTLLKDAYVNEPKKAQLAFYNMADQAVALKTLDGKHVVVDPIGQAQTGGRMVNEFKIAFAAYAGETSLASFDEMFLKKGRSYSYVLIPQGSGYRTISQANAIDPAE